MPHQAGKQSRDTSTSVKATSKRKKSDGRCQGSPSSLTAGRGCSASETPQMPLISPKAWKVLTTPESDVNYREDSLTQVLKDPNELHPRFIFTRFLSNFREITLKTFRNLPQGDFCESMTPQVQRMPSLTAHTRQPRQMHPTDLKHSWRDF